MFELRPKQASVEQSTEAYQNRQAHGQALTLSCYLHPKQPPVVWVLLLIFSGAWFAIVSGILYTLVFPELGLMVPLGAVALCAAALWGALVFAVYSSIKSLRPVKQLTLQGRTLVIHLADDTKNIWSLDQSRVRIHRVKNRNQDKISHNHHFRMTISGGGKQYAYDLLVNSEEEFSAFRTFLH